MKLILNAREVAGRYEYEVVASEPVTYDQYMKMYADLADWITSNAATFKRALWESIHEETN
jgi:hypothetical protein